METPISSLRVRAVIGSPDASAQGRLKPSSNNLSTQQLIEARKSSDHAAVDRIIAAQTQDSDRRGLFDEIPTAQITAGFHEERVEESLRWGFDTLVADQVDSVVCPYAVRMPYTWV